MKFKVGDVCIVTESWCLYGPAPFAVGDEVIIFEINAKWDAGYHPYRITECGNADLDWWFTERALRLKKPPIDRQELGSWDLCPWQPKEITVHD